MLGIFFSLLIGYSTAFIISVSDSFVISITSTEKQIKKRTVLKIFNQYKLS